MPLTNDERSNYLAEIARLSERVRSLDEKITEIRFLMNKMTESAERNETKSEDSYVTKLEYEPIRKLVYGAVGFILITVLSTFMLLIIKSGTIEKFPLSPTVTVK